MPLALPSTSTVLPPPELGQTSCEITTAEPCVPAQFWPLQAPPAAAVVPMLKGPNWNLFVLVDMLLYMAPSSI